MKSNNAQMYITHLYLMTDSPDFSECLYDLVNDLMNLGWEISADDRNDCFVHLVAIAMERTRLKRLLQRNPWLRAFAFRQLIVPVRGRPWTAHLEFGAYGGYSSKSLVVFLPARSNESNFDQNMTSEYDRSWLATSRVGSSSGVRNETITAVARNATGNLVSVRFRLAFHGLPDEVERCLSLATEMLSQRYITAAHAVSGNDRYQSVVMSFETQKDTAFRVFNRLVAHVPAATSVLDFEDPATGKPRALRAVDGKIDGGK